jgi:hypothetical protein
MGSNLARSLMATPVPQEGRGTGVASGEHGERHGVIVP